MDWKLDIHQKNKDKNKYKITLIHYMHAIASKKYKKYNKSQEIQVRCTQPKGISGQAAECSQQLQAINTRNTSAVHAMQLKGILAGQPTPHNQHLPGQQNYSLNF